VVWNFLGDVKNVAACLPGASVDGEGEDGRVNGQFIAKLGPITAKFQGQAQIKRDDARQSGVILGAGRDPFTGSRTLAEAEYRLSDVDADTLVEVTVRASLAGPLAQFGRSAIVETVAAQITKQFAQNINLRLSGGIEAALLKSHFSVGTFVWGLVKHGFTSVLSRFQD
jgi:carbon-monoxide dehydrogenase small subunit